MTTSSITFRRRARRGALALIVSAILLPAGSALAQGVSGPVGDRPADYFSYAPPVSGPAGDAPADYFRGPSPVSQTPPPVASGGQEASGFDWVSAGIGAAAAGVLIVVTLGAATAGSRVHLRTTRS